MRYVCYSYDIPKDSGDYPEPSAFLRHFAVHLQLSVWIVPMPQLPRTDPLTKKIRSLGGMVDVFDFDEMGHEKLLAKSRWCLERDINRLRKYVDESVKTTATKLAEAKDQVSIRLTNAAINYQRTAIRRAQQELSDAEECAVAFDLSGQLEELVQSTRKAIDAHAAAFSIEAISARAAAKKGVAPVVIAPPMAMVPVESPKDEEVDPSTVGFGTSPESGNGGSV